MTALQVYAGNCSLRWRGTKMDAVDGLIVRKWDDESEVSEKRIRK